MRLKSGMNMKRIVYRGINPIAIPKPSDNALSKVRSFPALIKDNT